ncbi:NADPH-flavin oxidoreductase [Halalkalibacter wakoensis JCM 9140]|uniref:NADPH-flavin oxidoreductase n=1 Tax=Halalkalibacter wakoensis JCM 9140 TaxID=1236970 RepID=W4Q1C8_9BACI|nr:oxygen-insensitive NADPH nitroreductase [Halalkalibacter wakoensis]GAE25760.1 NADPH-flavin oxidoreductase [Halalkalibacter wakoensis JCM 9140]
MGKNSVIDLIQSHRSIRKFTDAPVSEKQIDEVIASGRWAPTSHHVQAYSIIVVKEDAKKKELAKLAGNQAYVESCPVFFVICADFHRLKQVSELHDQPFEVGEQENVLVGAVDAALVAQNMLLAARSFDLGGVMIGGIRNNPEAVSKLLNLPSYTFPVMGLCIGVPDQDPEQKPRLPKEAVVHQEQYDATNLPKSIEDYDQVMETYYYNRTKGARADKWSEQMAHFFSTPKRPHVGEFLRGQGFLTRKDELDKE